MCQKMRLIIMILLVSIFVGCSSKNQDDTNNEDPDTENPNVTFNDFIGSMKTISSSNIDNNGNINVNTEGFFPDEVNSQVKVKGTNQVLLVDQVHLDAEPTDLYISIMLVTRTEESNGDVKFEGQIFLAQKSLIEDIKQAIASDPKEIEQATLDAKKFTFIFSDISFTFTFHPVNNGYIMPEEGEEYDSDRAVQVKDTNYILVALKSDLDADAQNLPDQVRVHLAEVPESLGNGNEIPTELNLSGEFLMVPKSVIADMKAALALDPVGTVERNSNTWHSFMSFTITIELTTTTSN